MPNAPFRLVAHPLPVIADVFGQPLRALALPLPAVRELGLRPRINRRHSCELRRNLYQRLANQHRDGIEI